MQACIRINATEDDKLSLNIVIAKNPISIDYVPLSSIFRMFQSQKYRDCIDFKKTTLTHHHFPVLQT